MLKSFPIPSFVCLSVFLAANQPFQVIWKPHPPNKIFWYMKHLTPEYCKKVEKSVWLLKNPEKCSWTSEVHVNEGTIWCQWLQNVGRQRHQWPQKLGRLICQWLHIEGRCRRQWLSFVKQLTCSTSLNVKPLTDWHPSMRTHWHLKRHQFWGHWQ